MQSGLYFRVITFTKCGGKWIGGGKPGDSNLRQVRDNSLVSGYKRWRNIGELEIVERTDRTWILGIGEILFQVLC